CLYSRGVGFRVVTSFCAGRTVALGSAGNFWAARGDSDRAGHLGQAFVVGRGFRRAAVGKPALGHDPPDSVYNRGHDLRGGPLTGAASRAIHLSRIARPQRHYPVRLVARLWLDFAHLDDRARLAKAALFTRFAASYPTKCPTRSTRVECKSHTLTVNGPVGSVVMSHQKR